MYLDIERGPHKELDNMSSWKLPGCIETSKNEVADNLVSVWKDKLWDLLEEIGCIDNIIEKLKFTLKWRDQFIVRQFFAEDSKTLCITIKADSKCATATVLLKKAEFFSIDLKTGKKEKKHMFRIV